MANLEGITAAELKEYLSSQIKRLHLLKKVLISIIAFVVIAIIGHIIYYYNYLTTLKSDMLTAEAQVSTAIQYRANLVPVLIESVVGFVEHEDNVFMRTVDARERSLVSSNQAVEALRQSAQQPMDDILKKIMAIAEQYPDLKTSEPFQLLMKQVSDAELQIYKQRVSYNDKVNIFTTATWMFPGNFYVALLFDFHFHDYFKGKHQSEWPTESINTLKYNDLKKNEKR
ncbi:MAG: LemA family protein [Desulfobacterales bacterium]|nr:LemA family protein [Desulfobacterales bacterium]